MKSFIALSALGFYALSANAQAAQWAQCKYHSEFSLRIYTNIPLQVAARYDAVVFHRTCHGFLNSSIRAGLVQQLAYPAAFATK